MEKENSNTKITSHGNPDLNTRAFILEQQGLVYVERA